MMGMLFKSRSGVSLPAMKVDISTHPALMLTPGAVQIIRLAEKWDEQDQIDALVTAAMASKSVALGSEFAIRTTITSLLGDLRRFGTEAGLERVTKGLGSNGRRDAMALALKGIIGFKSLDGDDISSISDLAGQSGLNADEVKSIFTVANSTRTDA
jgi:hypothetical protein